MCTVLSKYKINYIMNIFTFYNNTLSNSTYSVNFHKHKFYVYIIGGQAESLRLFVWWVMNASDYIVKRCVMRKCENHYKKVYPFYFWAVGYIQFHYYEYCVLNSFEMCIVYP